MKSTKINPR